MDPSAKEAYLKNLWDSFCVRPRVYAMASKNEAANYLQQQCAHNPDFPYGVTADMLNVIYQRSLSDCMLFIQRNFMNRLPHEIHALLDGSDPQSHIYFCSDIVNDAIRYMYGTTAATQGQNPYSTLSMGSAGSFSAGVFYASPLGTVLQQPIATQNSPGMLPTADNLPSSPIIGVLPITNSAAGAAGILPKPIALPILPNNILINASSAVPSSSNSPGVLPIVQQPAAPPPQYVPTAQALKNAPMCPIFAKGYCKSDCPNSHPDEERVCPEIIANEPCKVKACPFLHPNGTTLHILKEKISRVTSTPIDTMNKELADTPTASKKSKKVHGVLRWGKANSSTCRDDPYCVQVKCLFQHPKFVPTKLDAGIVTDNSADETKLVDVSKDAAHFQLVSDRLQRSAGRVYTILSLHLVVNTKLEKKWKTHLQKRLSEGKSTFSSYVFHGTNATAAQAIAKTGFLGSKITNHVYGYGHYFALDPDVSVGYCKGGNTMLLCQICHSSVNFADSVDYYVVPEDDAVLPMYIFTFSSKTK